MRVQKDKVKYKILKPSKTSYKVKRWEEWKTTLGKEERRGGKWDNKEKIRKWK